MARNALGKGLAALIPGPAAAAPAKPTSDYFLCDIARIQFDPDQPRQNFEPEALAELEQSIREKGVLQPLLVRAIGEGGPDGQDYLVVAGERRLRAATRVGLKKVPVLVKEVATEEAFELALIENIQRQDLNAIEEAAAYQRLLESRGYTQDALATRVGKSRVAIANSVRLLKLDGELRQLVVDGDLTAGHARSLLGVDDALHRRDLAARIVADGLSVRATEAAVQELKGAPDAPPKPRRNRRDPAPLQPYFDTVAAELAETLDLGVKVTTRGRKGRIVIEFTNVETLRALRDRIVGNQPPDFHDVTDESDAAISDD